MNSNDSYFMCYHNYNKNHFLCVAFQATKKRTQVFSQCHLDKDYTKNSVYRNMYPVLFCKIMLST